MRPDLSTGNGRVRRTPVRCELSVLDRAMPGMTPEVDPASGTHWTPAAPGGEGLGRGGPAGGQPTRPNTQDRPARQSVTPPGGSGHLPGRSLAIIAWAALVATCGLLGAIVVLWAERLRRRIGGGR